MKSITTLFMVMTLAPASLVTAQSAGVANYAATSFEQLQAGSPASQDMPDFYVSKAVPAGMEKSNSSACCTDSASCLQVKSRGLAALGVQQRELQALESSLATFNTMIKSQWYMTFPDGSALTDGSIGSLFISRKSLVGAYRFNVEKMSAEASWNADPSLGFSRPGKGSMGIGKFCFAPDRLEIYVSGKNLSVSAAPRPTVIQPSPNTGTDKPVLRDGYLISSPYGQYLVSSDGK